MRTKVLLLVSILLLAGCAGQWVRVQGQEVTHKGEGYEAQLPADWVKIQLGDTLVVTRDGPSLQKISLRSVPHVNAFEHLEKGANTEQLPSELAELYLADLRKEDQHQMPSLEILENGPATIAGHEGFRVRIEYRTADGVRYRLIGYGFTTAERFYSVSYNAPVLYYFDRDQDKLQQVVQSLKAG